MQGAQGHSRKESDDFKLSFGDDTSANFEVDGVNILMDPALELSLSFQQPKASFTFHSFCALFAIRIEVSQLKLLNSELIFRNPAPHSTNSPFCW